MAPPKVTAYLCGATVQALPHIGHLRSAVSFDVLIRWLMWHGYEVTLCRNITDIDDKILRCAEAEGVPYWQLAQRNERAFTADYQALGCLPPAIEPRATGHIPEMISLISRLIDTGHAYASEGDVYFSVRSWPHYGALSNQRPAQMLPADDGTRMAKRDPLDFALWKGVKPGEPWWDSPWGRGRPGWHLECSAMAEKYLGTAFDIHGGGRDLIFPHHENEVAQSQAAGDHFARYWVHNGLVTLGGEKMSKSGSSLQVGELLQQVRPVELRYYLASAHYRSNVDYSSAALNDAVAAYQRVEGFVIRAVDAVGEVAPDVELPAEFVAAMDDDLNTSQAIAVLHNVVRDGNTALAAGESAVVAKGLARTRAMLAVLGIDPLSETWRAAGAADLRHIVDALVAVALQQREEARTRRDFAAADSIRDQLSSAGVVIEDTPQGPRWTLKGDS